MRRRKSRKGGKKRKSRKARRMSLREYALQPHVFNQAMRRVYGL